MKSLKVRSLNLFTGREGAKCGPLGTKRAKKALGKERRAYDKAVTREA